MFPLGYGPLTPLCRSIQQLDHAQKRDIAPDGELEFRILYGLL